MKRNSCMYYIIFMAVILIAAAVYSDIYLHHLSGEDTTYYFPVFSAKFFGAYLFDIVLGSIFGLEHFLRNRKLSGKWHINLQKLLIMGIPLSLLSVSYFIFYLLAYILHQNVFCLIAPSREPFFRFLLGYTIITSFYKKAAVTGP